MTNREFCLERRKNEIAAFVKVLKAVPQGRLDYRPDPKGRTASELAWLLAFSEKSLATLLETGKVAWEPTPPPARVEEIVETYEKGSTKVNELIAKMSDDAWGGKGSLIMGTTNWDDKLGNMTWGFLFDAVHHRGQLTTYLRPMGSKVPSIYGPSADDSGE